jgi:hypothetical protein
MNLPAYPRQKPTNHSSSNPHQKPTAYKAPGQTIFSPPNGLPFLPLPNIQKSPPPHGLSWATINFSLYDSDDIFNI